MGEPPLHYSSIPNRWVGVQDDPSAQLTYVPMVNPTPLSVSTEELDPVLASLEVVITNATAKPIVVSEIDIDIPVGAPVTQTLTQSTAGVQFATTSEVWVLRGPASPVTDGIATYSLTPADGQGPSISVGPGDVIVVQIYQIETNDAPGTATIGIQETLGDGTVGSTSFRVTTFPAGFYFNSLTVAALSQSDYVAVAQVPLGTNVKLFWNASVVEVGSVKICQSTAAGQKEYTPATLGEWSPPTPPLLDTVFTVRVTTTATPGGVPLTASLSTSVSVQTPELVASTLTVNGKSTLSGAVTAGPIASGAIVAPEMTLSGALTAASVSTGTLGASGDSILNGVTANGPLTVNAPLTATQNLIAASALVNGAFTAAGLSSLNGGVNATGGPVGMFTAPQSVKPNYEYRASTDGFLVGRVFSPGGWDVPCVCLISGRTDDGFNAVATGGNAGFLSPDGTKSYGPNSQSFLLPVRKGAVFSVNAAQVTKVAAPSDFYWCPLGASTNPEALEVVGEAPATEPMKLLVRKPVPKGNLIRDLADLIESLAERPFPADKKVLLLELLSKLNVDACAAEPC